MEDNNKVTPSQGKECFRAGACKVARRGRRGMAFPEPKPRGPELPQKRLKTLDCGQGAVRAVRFNGESLELSESSSRLLRSTAQ